MYRPTDDTVRTAIKKARWSVWNYPHATESTESVLVALADDLTAAKAERDVLAAKLEAAVKAERERCLWWFNAQHTTFADYDCRQGIADGDPIRVFDDPPG